MKESALSQADPSNLSQVEEKAQEKEHLQNFPAVLASVLISILQKTHMRLGAFKELACGHNTYPLREDSNSHRLQTTPKLPGQVETSK